MIVVKVSTSTIKVDYIACNLSKIKEALNEYLSMQFTPPSDFNEILKTVEENFIFDGVYHNLHIEIEILDQIIIYN